MLGVVSALGSFFSLVTAGLKAATDYAIYLTGKKAQQNVDLTATVKQDQANARIDEGVSRLSDAELDDALAKRMQQQPGDK